VKHQLDSEGGKATARELAARSGVAPERAVRVNEAMAEVEKVARVEGERGGQALDARLYDRPGGARDEDGRWRLASG